MKIAQIAPIALAVPPKNYGGTERVVHNLTEELVKLGHEVTLFASGDSVTSAKLVSVTPKSLKDLESSDPYGQNILTSQHLGLAYKMQDQFDIIHDHLAPVSLPTANVAKTPVVYTYHGPFTPEVREIFSLLNKPYVVTISKKQAEHAGKQVNHAKTIYHGMRMDHYPFSDSPEDYLLFVGRITEEKGVHHAIEVAKRVGKKLIIAAKLETTFKPDVEYYEKLIKPELNEQIQWIGPVGEEERNELMKNALCFLHPVTWPEPFGLTLIETMACGTPVIAFNLGSIPEVIADGKTGFVVETVEEMVDAVQKVHTIDRNVCRQFSLEHYSAKRMALEYVEVYKQIIAHNKQKQTLLKQYEQDEFFKQRFNNQFALTSNPGSSLVGLAGGSISAWKSSAKEDALLENLKYMSNKTRVKRS